MPTCKYCGREFYTTAALGGHVRQKHREDKEQGFKASISHDTHCPICQYELPFTTVWEDPGMTVCPKCLSMFAKYTKEVISERGAGLRALGALPPMPT